MFDYCHPTLSKSPLLNVTIYHAKVFICLNFLIFMKQSFVGRNILAGLALLALSGCPSVNPSPYEPPPSTNSSGSNSSGSTSIYSGSPSNSGSSNSSGSSTSSLSRTGYSGLQTASEILQNPYVRANIQSLDNALARKYPEYADEETRIFLAKDNHLTPPIIEGDYTLMGRQLVPFEATLASGPYSLDNQTSNNFIDVAFDQSQIGQTTTGPSSTIIREKETDLQSIQSQAFPKRLARQQSFRSGAEPNILTEESLEPTQQL
jgi:hypothetical protein